MLAIAFDSSGVTTGILAVPFLLALSLGISNIKKDSRSSEKDSFGIISIASAGAIIMVLVLNYLFKPNLNATTINYINDESISVFKTFFNQIQNSTYETLVSMSPLILMGLSIGYIHRKIKSKRSLIRMAFGFIYTIIGLFLFLISILKWVIA